VFFQVFSNLFRESVESGERIVEVVNVGDIQSKADWFLINEKFLKFGDNPVNLVNFFSLRPYVKDSAKNESVTRNS